MTTTKNRKRTLATDRILGKEQVRKKRLTRKNISSVDILASKITGNPSFGSPSKLLSNLLVNAVLDSLRERLTEGDSVSLPGIGRLHIISTKERTGRNPSTGATLTIPSRKKIRFNAYANMKDDLNKVESD